MLEKIVKWFESRFFGGRCTCIIMGERVVPDANCAVHSREF